MKVLFKESWLIRDRAEKLVKISPWFYSSKEKFSFDLWAGKLRHERLPPTLGHCLVRARRDKDQADGTERVFSSLRYPGPVSGEGEGAA